MFNLSIKGLHIAHPIESFPDQKLVSGHHGDSWTNKLAKRDDRGLPLISPLEHADKASAGSSIG